LLPGSRSGEIRRMLGVFGEAVELLRSRGVRFELVLPTLPRLVTTVTQQTAGWRVRPLVVTEPVEHQAAFRIARAALAKSGTVTLELALAGVPMVAAYRVSLLEEMVARMALKLSSVILANLVLGENVVPEYLQRDCTAPALVDGLSPLLHDTPERRRQIEAFARLDAIMQVGQTPPSERAAEIVLRYVRRGRRCRAAGAGRSSDRDPRSSPSTVRSSRRCAPPQTAR
jgi:lipid-A-disaccharide synthase